MFGGATLLCQHKYTALLAVLLAMLVLQSFAITTGSERVWRDVMATVFGVAIFLVVFERSALQTVMAVFLFIAFLIGWSVRRGLSVARSKIAVVCAVLPLCVFTN